MYTYHSIIIASQYKRIIGININTNAGAGTYAFYCHHVCLRQHESLARESNSIAIRYDTIQGKPCDSATYILKAQRTQDLAHWD